MLRDFCIEVPTKFLQNWVLAWESARSLLYGCIKDRRRKGLVPLSAARAAAVPAMILEGDLLCLLSKNHPHKNMPNLAYRKIRTSPRVLYIVADAHLEKAREPNMLWLLLPQLKTGFPSAPYTEKSRSKSRKDPQGIQNWCSSVMSFWSATTVTDMYLVCHHCSVCKQM